MSSDDRRVAVVYVDERKLFEALVAFVSGQKVSPDDLIDAADTSILRECEVVRCSYHGLRRAFGVVLRHPSFAVVADGEMPPRLGKDAPRPAHTFDATE